MKMKGRSANDACQTLPPNRQADPAGREFTEKMLRRGDRVASIVQRYQ
jgi:hypothetical protein